MSVIETESRTRPESPAPPRHGYIPVLDGLRAVSIALVFVAHLTLSGQLFPSLMPYYHAFGTVGVSVFFVISGYLITSLLMREEAKYGKISFPYFYTRRALRLLPAFYLYLGVVFALWLAGLVPGHPWHSFVASLLYIRNYVGQGYETGHIWSLSIEEQFYLFWPLLMVAAGTRRARVTVLLIAIVCLWRAILVLGGRVAEGPLYMRTDLRIDTILVGCLLAFAARTGRARRFFTHGWVALGTLAGLVAWNGGISARVPYAGAIDTLVTAVLICGVVCWFLENPGAGPSRLLQGRGFVYVGRLSYSLYLWQQLFLAAPTTGLAAVRWFPLSLGLTVVAAVVSYHGIEQPFLRLKDRFFGRA